MTNQDHSATLRDSIARHFPDDPANAARAYAALTEALAQPQQPDGWRPIETAPKNGTHIILSNGTDVSQGHWLHEEPYIRERRDADGRYIDQEESDGFDGWIDFLGGMLPEPTMWQPLPSPTAHPSQQEDA